VAAPLAEITAVVRRIMRDADLNLLPSTRFGDLDNWDSMDLITVVVEVECRYDLQFDMPAIDRIVTVGDLLHMIASKQALVPV
jgi:acyl carrier protein